MNLLPIRRALSRLFPSPPPEPVASVISKARKALTEQDRRGKFERRFVGSLEGIASENALLRSHLDDRRAMIRAEARDYREAIALGGGGWMPRPDPNLPVAERAGVLREAMKVTSESDTTGLVQCKEYLVDLELALEDRGWQRELAYSDMEFSRYGIGRLIYIARLYVLKNPLIRRGVLISSYYVLARGLEISSPDETAQEVLQEFLDDPRNRAQLGHSALVQKDQTLSTDGALYWAFFSDPSTGQTLVRTIDAAEIEEIICDPQDASTVWFYRRRWMEQSISATGVVLPKPKCEWYVAIGVADNPKVKDLVANGRLGSYEFAKEENGQPIHVFHIKRGGLENWRFSPPEIYGAIDWARAVREYLEDWATVHRQLARLVQVIETKGGAPAIAALKQTFATTLANDLISTEHNPATVVGSPFITDAGNKVSNIKGAGIIDSAEQVRRLVLMIAAHFGIPETMLTGDAKSGSLATATSLDTPTELRFRERQQMWREALQTICEVAIRRSLRAPNGKLREAMTARGIDPAKVVIEMVRAKPETGTPHYVPIREADKPKVKPGIIKIQVDFPAILEHDIEKRINAIVAAMTLNGLQPTGIDRRLGFGLLLSELGVEDVPAVLEIMLPIATYNGDRSEIDQPNRVTQRDVGTGDGSAPTDATDGAEPTDKTAQKEADLTRAVAELRRALRESESRLLNMERALAVNGR